MNDKESGNSLSYFDRAIGNLHNLPDVVKTKESTKRIIPPFGIGSHVYVVTTYRQIGVGDTISLEMISDTEKLRVIIPPAIAEVLARHRDQLTGKTRSLAGKRNAEDRKARGLQPGFMGNRKEKK